MTVVPSVAGVEEAELFSRCMDSRSDLATEVCQTILPEVALSFRSRRLPFSGEAEVRKTESFQTMGEDWPAPGMGVFQAMLLVDDQVVGALFSLLMPSPRGPRNCGQFSAWTESTRVAANAA